MSKRMYHPCHKLSVPSAKIFWCRHCMQMFEDAISRWKHSKTCRGSSGVKHKDQDGQVIQMYVKPDKVSYTSNLAPGQPIIHKPQIKKTSADLKCVICQTKFYSLYDMREHVKYPCQRAYNTVTSGSDDSDSQDSIDKSSSLKIRRVEVIDNEVINTSTALAVLAEASKHVESLSHRGSYVSQFAHEETVPSVGQYVTESTSRDSFVKVTPTYPEFQVIEQIANSAGQYISIPVTRPATRFDLEPVVIVIQAEDGQDIPESSLDIETIQNCVKETVLTLPIGQIIEVQVNVRNRKTKHYTVGHQGTIFPIDSSQVPTSVKVISYKSANSKACDTDSTSTSAGYQVQGNQAGNHSYIESKQDASTSVLAEVLSGNIVASQDHTNQVGNTPHDNNLYTGSDIVIEGEVYPLHFQVNGNSIQVVGIEQKNINSVCEREHSYPGQPTSVDLNLATQNKLQNSVELNFAEQDTKVEDCVSQNSVELQIAEQNKFQNSIQVSQVQSGSLQNIIPVNQENPSGVELVGVQGQSEFYHIKNLHNEGFVDQVTQLPGTTTEQSHIEGVEVPQQVIVSTDSTVDLLNNLAYAYSTNVNNMATSGQHIAAEEDWFGFAELTGEPITNDCNKETNLAADEFQDDIPMYTAVKLMILKEEESGTKNVNAVKSKSVVKTGDKIAVNEIIRNTNEVRIPIVSEKYGVTKYKVLARQKVEDDEDIVKVKPKVDENDNGKHDIAIKEDKPTSANVEQRKENVKKKQKSGVSRKLSDKKKSEFKKVVEKKGGVQSVKQNLSGATKNKLVHLKGLKQSGKHETGNKHNKKKDETQNLLLQKKKLSSNLNLQTDKKVLSYEFQDESDENVKLEKSKTIKAKYAPKPVIKQTDNRKSNIKQKSSLTKAVKVTSKALKNPVAEKEKILPSEINHEHVKGYSVNMPAQKTSVKDKNETMKINKPVSSMCVTDIQNKLQSFVSSSEKCSPIHNCRVELKRDPSIESILTEEEVDVHEDVITIVTKNTEHLKRKLSEGDIMLPIIDQSANNESGRRHSVEVFDNLSFKRQKSLDDGKPKIDMVYDGEIEVRKSGRLRSAKCASRYRGDYGIRAETYSKIVKTLKDPLSETEENITMPTSYSNDYMIEKGGDDGKTSFTEGVDNEEDNEKTTGRRKTITVKDSTDGVKCDNENTDGVINEKKTAFIVDVKSKNNHNVDNDTKPNSEAETIKGDLKLVSNNVLSDKKLSHSVLAMKQKKGRLKQSILPKLRSSLDLTNVDRLEKTVTALRKNKMSKIPKTFKRSENINNNNSDVASCISQATTEEFRNQTELNHAGICDDGVEEKQRNVAHSTIKQLKNCINVSMEVKRTDIKSDIIDDIDIKMGKIDTEVCAYSANKCGKHSEKLLCDPSTSVPFTANTEKQCSCDIDTPGKEGMVGEENKSCIDKGVTKMNVECLSDSDSLCHSSQDTGIDEKGGKFNIKENITNMVKTLNVLPKGAADETSGYQHSVGKSVNKKENQLEERKAQRNEEIKNRQQFLDMSPEASPEKTNPIKVLENLRLKLFESAGANVQKANEKTKKFESKLISSKIKESLQNAEHSSLSLAVSENAMETTDLCKSTDPCSNRSGRTTPRCITPRSVNEMGHEILDEVAKTLDSMQKAKRKAEDLNSKKQSKPKRQRFEQKKFMLRSMLKRNPGLNSDSSVCVTENSDIKKIKLTDGSGGEKRAAKKHDEIVSNSDVKFEIEDSVQQSKTESDNNSVKSESLKTKSKHKAQSKQQQKVESEYKLLKDKENKLEAEKKVQPKPKLIKCQACGHSFKSRELLRKHYPCRIRQTRTWSQNKLRPNRAFRRTENATKKDGKFVCRLPKSKTENKSRPQLLKPRKTKFRRVKGKRRRKLYQLLQELIEKRKPKQWPHFNVIYEDLSFKEQCLYKLGLLCIGNTTEGLEKYDINEVEMFEKHRVKEMELLYDSINFQPSIPDIDEEPEEAGPSASFTETEMSAKDISEKEDQLEISRKVFEDIKVLETETNSEISEKTSEELISRELSGKSAESTLSVKEDENNVTASVLAKEVYDKTIGETINSEQVSYKTVIEMDKEVDANAITYRKDLSRGHVENVISVKEMSVTENDIENVTPQKSVHYSVSEAHDTEETTGKCDVNNSTSEKVLEENVNEVIITEKTICDTENIIPKKVLDESAKEVVATEKISDKNKKENITSEVLDESVKEVVATEKISDKSKKENITSEKLSGESVTEMVVNEITSGILDIESENSDKVFCRNDKELVNMENKPNKLEENTTNTVICEIVSDKNVPETAWGTESGKSTGDTECLGKENDVNVTDSKLSEKEYHSYATDSLICGTLANISITETKISDKERERNVKENTISGEVVEKEIKCSTNCDNIASDLILSGKVEADKQLSGIVSDNSFNEMVVLGNESNENFTKTFLVRKISGKSGSEMKTLKENFDEKSEFDVLKKEIESSCLSSNEELPPDFNKLDTAKVVSSNKREVSDVSKDFAIESDNVDLLESQNMLEKDDSLIKDLDINKVKLKLFPTAACLINEQDYEKYESVNTAWDSSVTIPDKNQVGDILKTKVKEVVEVVNESSVSDKEKGVIEAENEKFTKPINENIQGKTPIVESMIYSFKQHNTDSQNEECVTKNDIETEIVEKNDKKVVVQSLTLKDDEKKVRGKSNIENTIKIVENQDIIVENCSKEDASLKMLLLNAASVINDFVDSCQTDFWKRSLDRNEFAQSHEYDSVMADRKRTFEYSSNYSLEQNQNKKITEEAVESLNNLLSCIVEDDLTLGSASNLKNDNSIDNVYDAESHERSVKEDVIIEEISSDLDIEYPLAAEIIKKDTAIETIHLDNLEDSYEKEQSEEGATTEAYNVEHGDVNASDKEECYEDTLTETVPLQHDLAKDSLDQSKDKTIQVVKHQSPQPEHISKVVPDWNDSYFADQIENYSAKKVVFRPENPVPVFVEKQQKVDGHYNPGTHINEYYQPDFAIQDLKLQKRKIDHTTEETHNINPTTEETHNINPTTEETHNIDPSTVETHNINPTTVETHNINPTTAETLNINPTTVETHNINPTTVETHNSNPTTEETHNINRTTVETHNSNRTTVETHNINPTTVETHNSNRTTVETHNINPTTVETHNINPTTVETHNINPTTVETHNINPTTVETHNINPTTVETHNINPTTVEPHNSNHTTEETHNINPTTVETHNSNHTTEETHNINPTTVETHNINPTTDKTDIINCTTEKTDKINCTTEKTDKIRDDIDSCDNFGSNSSRYDVSHLQKAETETIEYNVESNVRTEHEESELKVISTSVDISFDSAACLREDTEKNEIFVHKCDDSSSNEHQGKKLPTEESVSKNVKSSNLDLEGNLKLSLRLCEEINDNDIENYSSDRHVVTDKVSVTNTDNLDVTNKIYHKKENVISDSQKIMSDKEEDLDQKDNLEQQNSVEDVKVGCKNTEIDSEFPADITGENKSDFTIKYEMNGLLIVENLLTGDKNLARCRSQSELSMSGTEEDVASSINTGDEMPIETESTKGESCHGDDKNEHYNQAGKPMISVAELEISGRNGEEEVGKMDKDHSILQDISGRESIKNTYGNKTFNETPNLKIIDGVLEEAFIVEDDKNLTKTQDKGYNEDWDEIEKMRKDVSDLYTKEDDIATPSISFCDDIVESDEQELISANTEEENRINKSNEVVNFIVDDNDTKPIQDTSVGPLPNLETSFVTEDESTIIEENEEIPVIDIETPPILEKVEMMKSCIEIYDSTLSSEDSQQSVSGPPILEPEPVLPISENINTENDDTGSSTQKLRNERHFLDVLDEVCEIQELDVLGELNEQQVDMSEMSHTKKRTQKKNKSLFPPNTGTGTTDLDQNPVLMTEEIGRHFSDVVDNSLNSEETSKPGSQFLLSNSDNGEVTLAKIKEMLQTKSKVENKVSKESLLKLRSDIANLFSKFKTPVKKDPVWLKRDALTNYNTNRKIRKNKRNKLVSSERKILFGTLDDDSEISDEATAEDDTQDSNSKLEQIWSDEDDHSIPESEIQLCQASPEGTSKGTITDNIMQMLTSFEAKGSLADNMSNLLDILAENLGFLGKTGQMDEDEDSSDSYSYNEECPSKCLRSKFKVGENMTTEASFDDTDEPPSLDDIPTAEHYSIQYDSDHNTTEVSGRDSEPECSFSDYEADINNYDVDKSGEFHSFKMIAHECKHSHHSDEHTNENEKLSAVHDDVIEQNATLFSSLLGEQIGKKPDDKQKASLFKHDTNIPDFTSAKQECGLPLEDEFQNTPDKDLPSDQGNSNNKIYETLTVSESTRKSPMSCPDSEYSGHETIPKDLNKYESKSLKASTIFKSITELNSIASDEDSNLGDSFDAVSMPHRFSDLKALSEDGTSEVDSEIMSDIVDSEYTNAEEEEQINGKVIQAEPKKRDKYGDVQTTTEKRKESDKGTDTTFSSPSFKFLIQKEECIEREQKTGVPENELILSYEPEADKIQMPMTFSQLTNTSRNAEDLNSFNKVMEHKHTSSKENYLRDLETYDAPIHLKDKYSSRTTKEIKKSGTLNKPDESSQDHAHLKTDKMEQKEVLMSGIENTERISQEETVSISEERCEYEKGSDYKMESLQVTATTKAWDPKQSLPTHKNTYSVKEITCKAIRMDRDKQIENVNKAINLTAYYDSNNETSVEASSDAGVEDECCVHAKENSDIEEQRSELVAHFEENVEHFEPVNHTPDACIENKAVDDIGLEIKTKEMQNSIVSNIENNVNVCTPQTLSLNTEHRELVVGDDEYQYNNEAVVDIGNIATENLDHQKTDSSKEHLFKDRNKLWNNKGKKHEATEFVTKENDSENNLKLDLESFQCKHDETSSQSEVDINNIVEQTGTENTLKASEFSDMSKENKDQHDLGNNNVSPESKQRNEINEKDVLAKNEVFSIKNNPTEDRNILEENEVEISKIPNTPQSDKIVYDRKSAERNKDNVEIGKPCENESELPEVDDALSSKAYSGYSSLDEDDVGSEDYNDFVLEISEEIEIEFEEISDNDSEVKSSRTNKGRTEILKNENIEDDTCSTIAYSESEGETEELLEDNKTSDTKTTQVNKNKDLDFGIVKLLNTDILSETGECSDSEDKIQLKRSKLKEGNSSSDYLSNGTLTNETMEQTNCDVERNIAVSEESVKLIKGNNSSDKALNETIEQTNCDVEMDIAASEKSSKIINQQYINEPFYETIADKVKRKQRERQSKSFNLNQTWLTNTGISLPDSNVREISIFRKSIQEKKSADRARAVSLPCDIGEQMELSVKRNNSVPKELKVTPCSVKLEPLNKPRKVTKDFHLKPCSVTVEKLDENTIQRYIARKKRHSSQERQIIQKPKKETRPPIKVTIKLNQITVPPLDCSFHYSDSNSSDDDPSDESDTESESSESVKQNALSPASSTSSSICRTPDHKQFLDLYSNHIKRNKRKNKANKSPCNRKPIKLNVKELLMKANSFNLNYESDTSFSSCAATDLDQPVNETYDDKTDNKQEMEFEKKETCVNIGEKFVVRDLNLSESDTDEENNEMEKKLENILERLKDSDEEDYLGNNCATIETKQKSVVKGSLHELNKKTFDDEMSSEYSEKSLDINKNDDGVLKKEDCKLSKDHQILISSVAEIPNICNAVNENETKNATITLPINSDKFGVNELDVETEPIAEKVNNQTKCASEENSYICVAENTFTGENKQPNVIELKEQHEKYCFQDTGMENIKASVTDKDGNDIQNENENDKAVLNMTMETFADHVDFTQQIDNEKKTDGDVYYAVEMTDGIEIEEAVSNLECVELLEANVTSEFENSTNIVYTNEIETETVQCTVTNDYEVREEEILYEGAIENISNEEVVENQDLIDRTDNMVKAEIPIKYISEQGVESKYIYGINEDSQSSTEIVEECVQDPIDNLAFSIETVKQVIEVCSETAVIADEVSAEYVEPLPSEYAPDITVESAQYYTTKLQNPVQSQFLETVDSVYDIRKECDSSSLEKQEVGNNFVEPNLSIQGTETAECKIQCSKTVEVNMDSNVTIPTLHLESKQNEQNTQVISEYISNDQLEINRNETLESENTKIERFKPPEVEHLQQELFKDAISDTIFKKTNLSDVKQTVDCSKELRSDIIHTVTPTIDSSETVSEISKSVISNIDCGDGVSIETVMEPIKFEEVSINKVSSQDNPNDADGENNHLNCLTETCNETTEVGINNINDTVSETNIDQKKSYELDYEIAAETMPRLNESLHQVNNSNTVQSSHEEEGEVFMDNENSSIINTEVKGFQETLNDPITEKLSFSNVVSDSNVDELCVRTTNIETMCSESSKGSASETLQETNTGNKCNFITKSSVEERFPSNSVNTNNEKSANLNFGNDKSDKKSPKVNFNTLHHTDTELGFEIYENIDHNDEEDDANSEVEIADETIHDELAMANVDKERQEAMEDIKMTSSYLDQSKVLTTDTKAGETPGRSVIDVTDEIRNYVDDFDFQVFKVDDQDEDDFQD